MHIIYMYNNYYVVGDNYEERDNFVQKKTLFAVFIFMSFAMIFVFQMCIYNYRSTFRLQFSAHNYSPPIVIL